MPDSEDRFPSAEQTAQQLTSHDSLIDHAAERDQKTLVTEWLAEPMPRDVREALDRLAKAPDVCRVAVMPDVHLAADVCNGTVVATRHLLYPQAVGGDIGCGMVAIAINESAEALRDEDVAAKFFSRLYALVPSNRHSKQTAAPELPESLKSVPFSHQSLEYQKDRDYRVQLGTLGRGNHFLELQRDTEDRLWLMLHTGSRAAGQEITEHHLNVARARATKILSRPPGLLGIEADSEAGRAYLNDLAWAIDYANQNRLTIVRRVEEIVQSLFGCSLDWTTLIHGHHNHVRRERHDRRDLWVHRKGASSAEEGELAAIPGSMGTRSFHVTGRGCAASLRSSSHGAGRTLARGQARTKIGAKQLQRELTGVWYDHRLTDALREEAPSAYKDIRRVMQAQRELTVIVRELRPVLCYKGT